MFGTCSYNFALKKLGQAFFPVQFTCLIFMSVKKL